MITIIIERDKNFVSWKFYLPRLIGLVKFEQSEASLFFVKHAALIMFNAPRKSCSNLPNHFQSLVEQKKPNSFYLVDLSDFFVQIFTESNHKYANGKKNAQHSS